MIWNPYFFKIKFQMVHVNLWISNQILTTVVQTIQRLHHSKSGRFCLDFKCFLTKRQPFVQISNVWASWFQIPFEIQTICKPTSIWPFKIQTNPDLRSPLYSRHSVIEHVGNRMAISSPITEWSVNWMVIRHQCSKPFSYWTFNPLTEWWPE